MQTTYPKMIENLARAAPKIKQYVDEMRLTDVALRKLAEWYFIPNNMQHFAPSVKDHYKKTHNPPIDIKKNQWIKLFKFMSFIRMYGALEITIKYED